MPRSDEITCNRDARYGLYGLEPDHEIKVNIRHQLPANIILVHGVNDVGTSYPAVESGLCEGLTKRLDRGAVAACYSIPGEADLKKLVPDPDAVFYKRKTNEQTHSPVIPFYWGFREVTDKASTKNGQRIDRFGNRLDRDLSKGGGPFANATSSIPDMWNRGVDPPSEQMGDDPVRPVRQTPGRMYMVLAAMRLAALVGIIRDRHQDDVVNIVAHSQGCLVSLLAQAILMEKGLAPADTLILTHPPYALDDSLGFVWRLARRFTSNDGTDPGMEPYYPLIDRPQTLHARLQTLVNIVKGVAECGAMRSASLPFGALREDNHDGMVGSGWRAEADRDNRGKVYLYFCPEDMTVALSAVKGIGWQGVPNQMEGRRVDRNRKSLLSGGKRGRLEDIVRYPMKELGPNFYQRVFTEKMRGECRGEPKPEFVGSSRHDFVLRLDREDDHAHVSSSARVYRERLPRIRNDRLNDIRQSGENHAAIRDINAEPLPVPVLADLRSGDHIMPGSPELQGAKIRAKDADGPLERIDPIDSAIATAADGGIQTTWLFIPDADAGHMDLMGSLERSPAPEFFAGEVQRKSGRDKELESRINAGRVGQDQYRIHQVYLCLEPNSVSTRAIGYLVEHDELPAQARLRWQNSFTPKSYHSAIIGSKQNHASVTAYDISIGAGRSVSEMKFCGFLCAIADWRKPVRQEGLRQSSGVVPWEKFLQLYANELSSIRPEWRILIEETKTYYNSGKLPASLPLIAEISEEYLICEATDGAFKG